MSAPHHRWGRQARTRLALPLAVLAVRVFGFKRTLRWAAPGPGARVAPSEARQVQAALAAALARDHRPGMCLTRSLALLWLLRGQGLAGALRIGGRREAGQFLAHAWVEHDGVPLNDVPGIARAYTPFESNFIPAGTHWS